jgi:hypothetical protein
MEAKGIDYYVNKRGWFNYEDVGMLDVKIGSEAGIVTDGLDFVLVRKLLHRLRQNDTLRVVPDLLSYLRALLAPSESNAKGLAITRGKGITKVGRGGSVLAIGAQEQLLVPDKLGSKAIKGNGTQVEGDRNVSQHQNGNGSGIGDARDFNEIAGDIGRDFDVDLQDEGEGENGVDQGKVSKDAGYLGWESSVLDF